MLHSGLISDVLFILLIHIPFVENPDGPQAVIKTETSQKKKDESGGYIHSLTPGTW